MNQIIIQNGSKSSKSSKSAKSGRSPRSPRRSKGKKRGKQRVISSSSTKTTKKQTARIIFNRCDVEDEYQSPSLKSSDDSETEIEEEADDRNGERSPLGSTESVSDSEHGDDGNDNDDDCDDDDAESVDSENDGEPFQCSGCGEMVHSEPAKGGNGGNGGTEKGQSGGNESGRNEEEDDALSGRSSTSPSPPKPPSRCSCAECLRHREEASILKNGTKLVNKLLMDGPTASSHGRRGRNGKKFMVSMSGRRRFRSTSFSVHCSRSRGRGRHRQSHSSGNPMDGASSNNHCRSGSGSQRLTPSLSVSVQLQLFAEHFLLFHDALCQQFWRRMGKELENEGELRLLAEAAAIFEAVGLKNIPKRWCSASTDSVTSTLSSSSTLKLPLLLRPSRSLTVYHHKEYHSLSRPAASLSPYIREFMGRSFDCIVDLSWIDGERHHIRKLLSFLEYHTKEPMPCIATPVRSKKLGRVVPKWYADFALQCDRKDCFIMILIGNGLAIAPLVHLFCARIATMIKALKPQEVREIMALEEDVQKQQALNMQLQKHKELINSFGADRRHQDHDDDDENVEEHFDSDQEDTVHSRHHYR